MAKPELPPVDFTADLATVPAKAIAKALAATPGDTLNLDPRHLRVLPGFNVRITSTPDYQSDIAALKDSIRESGFYRSKPIAGFASKDAAGDHFVFVTDGHRRLEAVMQLIAEGVEIASVPVVLQAPGTNLEDLTVEMLRSGMASRTLKPLEVAVGCQRLLRYGWSDEQVARKVGLTPQYLTGLIGLLGAPAPIRNAVASGKVAASLAVEVLKKQPDPKKAVQALREALARAEAAGKTKATRKHLDDATKAPKRQRAAAPVLEPVEAAPPAPPPAAPPVNDVYFWREAANYAANVITGDGLNWLRLWLAEDIEIVSELEAYTGQPTGSFLDPALRRPVEPVQAAREPPAAPEAPVTPDDPYGGL